TNNDILNGVTGPGFFVDGARNVGPSGTRNTLISGNHFDSNDVGANIGKRSLQNATISNNEFNNNDFDGLQGGPKDSLITQNTFANNGRSGLALTSFSDLDPLKGAQNSNVTENNFFGNASEDLKFSAAQAAGTISTNHAFGNSFGSSTAVRYDGTETIDASGNWWGSNTEAG